MSDRAVVLQETGIRVSPATQLQFSAQSVLGESPPTIVFVLRLVDGTLVPTVDVMPPLGVGIGRIKTFILGDSDLVYAALIPPDDGVTEDTMYGSILLVGLFSGAGEIRRPLASGYITRNQGVVWPPTSSLSPRKSIGLYRFTQPGNPPVGTQFSVSFESRAHIEVESIRYTVVTSAAAATRQLGIECLSGGQVAFRIWATSTQAASLTRSYWYDIRGFGAAAVLTDIFTPIPFIPLEGIAVVRSIADSFQAGDQLSVPSIYGTVTTSTV